MKVNEIIIKELIKNKKINLENLTRLKRRVAKNYKINCPSNTSLLQTYHEMVRNKRVKKSEKIEVFLRTRPIRSLSGIVNISVLTKPFPCPGKCLYCPTEKGIPKSYVSGEPAVERAKKLKYSPFLQVRKRIEMLEKEGHPTDKIELRIVGGTWSYYPKKYQNWFIKICFEACNYRNYKLQNTNYKQIPNSNYQKLLEKEQRKNEKAKHKIVGLSVETRPDFINKKEVERLRRLGVTMVELGVQSIYDDVLKINSRGHGVEEIISATKMLKDSGFKVLYQMMPNLPGSTVKKDEKMFKELFENPDFQPDLLKIYPCALLKNAPLYQWWMKGLYRPYSKKQLIKLIKEIKKKVPYYVRIQRITRDIPSQSVVAGAAKISNLRQITSEKTKKEDWQCKCIRCREIRGDYNPKEKVFLFRKDYAASEGKEIFLSFENKNRKKIFSLLRLRLHSKNKAIVREIHTYGQQLAIDQKKGFSPQHKGFGKKLIKTAEKIAKKEFGLKKITVISGVGARNYFRKLGYRLIGTYMVKRL